MADPSVPSGLWFFIISVYAIDKKGTTTNINKKYNGLSKYLEKKNENTLLEKTNLYACPTEQEWPINPFKHSKRIIEADKNWNWRFLLFEHYAPVSIKQNIHDYAIRYCFVT